MCSALRAADSYAALFEDETTKGAFQEALFLKLLSHVDAARCLSSAGVSAAAPPFLSAAVIAMRREAAQMLSAAKALRALVDKGGLEICQRICEPFHKRPPLKKK